MNDGRKQVRFIRKNGRIIPIEVDVNVNNHIGGGKSTRKRNSGNGAVTAGALGVSGAGLVAAADAARTRRIYERNGVTIDRKKWAVQPFVFDRLGDKLVMRDKLGKKIGQANWYKNVAEGDVVGSFSWLGVKKKYRGEGHSKTLSRVAAHEMKKAGMTGIWNQVVHEGSLKTNANKHDSFWKIKKSTGKGQAILEKVSMSSASKNINWHRKTKGVFTSDIFRMTKLSKQRTVMPGIRKAYMAKGTKVKLAVGIAAAVAGLAGAVMNEQ